MAYYDLVRNKITTISFVVSTVSVVVSTLGLLLGLPDHIDDWLEWRQIVSPNVLNSIFALGIVVFLVTLLAATKSKWSHLLPGSRLRKLSRLLQEGKELDSAFTSATAARSPDDFDILLDFGAHTELIRLEILRLYHVDIDTSPQIWPMIIRELAPLAREGMNKEVKQRCERFAANLSK